MSSAAAAGQEELPPDIAELVATKRVIVCCGAGGVGKTTTSTGLALAGARMGRRVLALTVDPSKRLAETLGVARNLREPISLPDERLKAAGIEPPGSLETWMLDPQLVSDRLVHRLSTEEEAERLTQNRIYKQLSRMVAGMQEYMAMEALYDFMQQDRYDLIILDTPPSRNALNFLEGPSRLGSFLDGRIFQLFLPGERKSVIRRAASGLISRVAGAVFGQQSYRDLQDFFDSFKSILGVMNRNAAAMVKRLSNEREVAFLMISSPAPEALTDAFFFRKKALEMDLPFRGFVLNRSQAYDDGRTWPDDSLLPAEATEAHRSALAKLQGLARLEMAQVERDRDLLADLQDHAGERAIARALPALPGGANELGSLLTISECLMEG